MNFGFFAYFCSISREMWYFASNISISFKENNVTQHFRSFVYNLTNTSTKKNKWKKEVYKTIHLLVNFVIAAFISHKWRPILSWLDLTCFQLISIRQQSILRCLYLKDWQDLYNILFAMGYYELSGQ